MTMYNKKLLLASLFATPFVLSSGAALAASANDTFELSVTQPHTISLAGTAFSATTSPTFAEIDAGTEVTVGSATITSTSTNCTIAVTSANALTLKNGNDWLVQLEVQIKDSGGTTLANFTGFTDAKNVVCADVDSITVKTENVGQASWDNTDNVIPGVVYTDILSVTVENQ